MSGKRDSRIRVFIVVQQSGKDLRGFSYFTFHIPYFIVKEPGSGYGIWILNIEYEIWKTITPRNFSFSSWRRCEFARRSITRRRKASRLRL